MTSKKFYNVGHRFPRLERLLLDDNRIKTVDSKSFVEMTQLVYLSLEGNQLTHIPGICHHHFLYKLTLFKFSLAGVHTRDLLGLFVYFVFTVELQQNPCVLAKKK